MRLGRFNRNDEPPSLARLGVLIDSELVADIRASYATYLHKHGDPHGREIAALRMPPAIASFLQVGAVGQNALQLIFPWLREMARSSREARGPADEALFSSVSECRLHAPVRLTKLIAVYDNYRKDSGATPYFAMKPSTAVVGPTRDIMMPKDVRALTCAAGLAVVIGRRCKDITEAEAYDSIAGYTLITDVRVRELALHGEAAAFRAGMFESFAPSGPWLATKDEIDDPLRVRIEMRVNGTLHQSFTLADLTWGIPRLVAFLSRMTLEPGDVIWTGSAPLAESDPGIRPGDLVEASVDGIGHLRNRVVE